MNRVCICLLSAFFVRTIAQSSSSLPACGQVCSASAGAAAIAAGCTLNNAQCYCSQAAFADKLNACATVTCVQSSDIAAVNSYAQSYCAGTTSSSTASTASTTSASSSTTTTSPSATSNSATPSPNASGLSTGAKLGISLGALVGIAAIAGVLSGFFCTRRRQTRRAEAARQSVISQRFVEDAEFFAAGHIAKKEVESPESFEAVRDSEARRSKEEKLRNGSAINEMDATQTGNSTRSTRAEIVAPVPRRPLPAYELPAT